MLTFKQIFGLSIVAFSFYVAFKTAKGFEFVYNEDIYTQNKLELHIVNAGAFLVILFAFSFCFNNLIFVDFFWPLYPIIRAISVFQKERPTDTNDFNLKSFIPLIFLIFYGLRLAAYRVATFKGLGQQNWKYSKYEKKAKLRFFYWIFSLIFFFAIPGILNVLATSVLTDYLQSQNFTQNHTISQLQLIAIAIMFFSQYLQATTDKQVLELKEQQQQNNNDSSKLLLKTGFWKYCRHPNYLGDMLFWWGLYFFCAEQNKFAYPVGAFLLSLKFICFTGTQMDNHLLETRKDTYPKYKNAVISSFIPFITIGRP